jgi:hypothetical protein
MFARGSKTVSNPKRLKSGFIEDIENCLSNFKFETEVLFELSSIFFSKSEEIFLLALTTLLKFLGEPDFQSFHNERIDYRIYLDLNAPFVVVWDFDYHCLSLTLNHEGLFKDKVLLRSHVV